MHFVDRWLWSMFIVGATTLILVIAIHPYYSDVIETLFVAASLNNLRLTLTRNRSL